MPNQFNGIIDLVTRKAYQYDGKPEEEPIEIEIPEELKDTVEEKRNELIEAVAEFDDELMEKYLGDEEISEELIKKAIRKGTLAVEFFPVLCGTALGNKGVKLLLDAVLDYLPSPTDIDSVKGDYYYVHSRTCQNDNRTISPNGDVAQCVFTSAKPFYNVNTKKLCYTNYDNILKIQDTLKDDCKNCSLLKYCKGDCCLVLWDETGCATPKKIYEHILKGKKNV